MKLTIKEIADCFTRIHPESRQIPASFSGGKSIADILWGSKNVSIDTLYTHAHFDSREVKKGSIFFCLKGEQQDGHSFATSAAQAGATLIIAEHDPFITERSNGSDFPHVILVDNSVKALWRLAMLQRKKTRAVVLGITGSAGKTTVKESLAHILSGVGKTEKNYKNFNTQTGLSLCIINADENADFWVMEAGISQPHDMDELGIILQPDVAVVLNVANAHAEGLGDKGVAWYKSRLFHYLTDSGVGFFSADYQDLFDAIKANQEAFEKRSILLLNFSSVHENVYSYTEFEHLLRQNNQLMGVFLSMIREQHVNIIAPFAGSYGAENVAAIVAVSLALGVDFQLITERMATIDLPDQRFHTVAIGSSIIIDDSYNANPLSSKRMILAAQQVAEFEKKDLILVMGEMRELGEESFTSHEEVGESMAQSNAHCILWKGGQSDAIKKALDVAGYKGAFYTPKSSEEFLQHIMAVKNKSNVVLFKGSRGTHIEEWLTAYTDILEKI